jgi:ribosome-binding factor A
MRALAHAKGYIQKRLFEELSLRHVPSIAFHIDQGIEHSVRISRILREEGVSEDSGLEELPEEVPGDEGNKRDMED